MCWWRFSMAGISIGFVGGACFSGPSSGSSSRFLDLCIPDIPQDIFLPPHGPPQPGNGRCSSKEYSGCSGALLNWNGAGPMCKGTVLRSAAKIVGDVIVTAVCTLHVFWSSSFYRTLNAKVGSTGQSLWGSTSGSRPCTPVPVTTGTIPHLVLTRKLHSTPPQIPSHRSCSLSSATDPPVEVL